MTRGYDFHPEAEADLESVWEYIAADNPGAADGMIDAIEAAIGALVPFPHQGHRRPDLTSRPLRFRKTAAVGGRDYAWTPEPARHGGNPERP